MLDALSNQYEPELSGSRDVGQSGREPELGGERALDWELWGTLLNDSAPAHLRVALIPSGQRGAYFSALLKVLPRDATYTRRTRKGDTWHGRYTNAQRLSAIGLLGALRDPRAVRPLAVQLNDPSNHVRVAVVMALGWIGGPAAVNALIHVLSHPHEPTRAEAARWLGWMGNPAAFEPLARALDDEAENVRMAAVRSLVRLGDPRAFGPLIEAFWRREGMERDQVLEELCRYDRSRTVRVLIQARCRAGTPRYEAATRALRRLATPEALAALEGYDHRLTGNFDDV